MALDSNNARFLLWLRANGVEFGDVLTVGRLGVFLSPEVLASDAARFGIEPSGSSWFEGSQSPYSESLILAMGARSVHALDYSSYEGAEILHDLNKPLPHELGDVCDLLFDSGSLEHVFNVPEALASYIKLVRPGGRIILDMPTTGCCGHGFYQFSPELFFNFFNAQRRCRVETMFCAANEPFSDWFLVPDPADIGQRVEIHSRKPIHLFVVIQRLEKVTGEITESPVQGDYEKAWNKDPIPDEAAVTETKAGLASRLKHRVRGVLRKLMPSLYWKFSVVRNEAIRSKAFTLGPSSILKRIDPFTWRSPLG